VRQGSVAALHYRSARRKELEWHPIADRSAAAINDWIEAAQITTGPLFPRFRRQGETVTHDPVTAVSMEHLIAAAQSTWCGPRISVRSLHRGRAADSSHPNAGRENRQEQNWRVSGGQHQYLQCRWKDEPSAMEQWFRERELAKRGG
jgi:hypothetical protein